MATFETEDTGGARRRPAASNGGAHNPLDIAKKEAMTNHHDYGAAVAKGQTFDRANSASDGDGDGDGDGDET